MAVRKSLNQIRHDLEKKFSQSGQYWLDRSPADLGNYSGVVRVPNKPSMVYARLSNGQIVEVFNDIAPAIYNWKVYVGRDKSQPSLYKVIEVRWVHNVAAMVNYVVFHHTQHEYPAPDTVWVQRDQFMPLLVLPNGGLHVRLYGDVIYSIGMSQPLRVPNYNDIDLSSYAVVTGAKYVLMEITPAGSLNYVAGSTYGSLAILRSSGTFPVPTPGSFPVCVIEFYENQTEIRRDSTVRNIIDLRMFTSGAEIDAGSQWHTAPAQTSMADADEMGVWNAIASALRKITWANLKLSIKAYTDTLYPTFNDAEGNPADVTTNPSSDGVSTYAARRDHVHHAPASASGLQIVMDPYLVDPPVPVLTPDGDDYVYYEV